MSDATRFEYPAFQVQFGVPSCCQQLAVWRANQPSVAAAGRLSAEPLLPDGCKIRRAVCIGFFKSGVSQQIWVDASLLAASLCIDGRADRCGKEMKKCV